MNLLDENIPEHQRQLLRGWRISVRQIGLDVGHKGLSSALHFWHSRLAVEDEVRWLDTPEAKR